MNNNYWSNRNENANKAKQHTKKMQEIFQNEIAECIKNTEVYSEYFKLYFKLVKNDKKSVITNFELIDEDSVSAIFNHSEGNTSVLNFASYKNPGGKFIDGSIAQEECLCHESFLYNVLSMKPEYYNWNQLHLNKAQYLNRALYSPNVIFIKEGKKIKCNVITCAAPNYTPALKYGNVTAEENSRNLALRIKFVLDIAEYNHNQTLILGAYGCGVFGQDPKEVCKIFLDTIIKNDYSFKNVYFAIPKGPNGNYQQFNEIITQYFSH